MAIKTNRRTAAQKDLDNLNRKLQNAQDACQRYHKMGMHEQADGWATEATLLQIKINEINS